MKVLDSIYSEKTAYVITALGLVAVPIELYFYWQFSREQNLIALFICNIFFLNGLHTLFGLQLLSKKSFQDALSRGYGGKLRNFIICAALVFVATFAYYFVEFKNIKLSSEQLFFFKGFAILALGLWPLHHGITQCFGILQIYNHADRPSDNTLNVEKYCRWIIYYGCLLATAVRFFPGRKTDALMKTLDVLLIAGVVIAAIAVVAMSVRHAGVKSKKTLFSLRFLLFPFKYLSLSAVIASGACHGIEYYNITKTIREKSSGGREVICLALKSLMVLFVLSNFGLFLKYFNPEPRSAFADYALILLFSTFWVSTFSHYMMDREFFKFRNAATRSEIAPLLQEAKVATQAEPEKRLLA